MKGSDQWIQRLADELDLASEPVPGVPLVEVYGHRRVLIENHLGVCQYGQSEIGVKVSYGQILVKGTCLELSRMTREQLVISGCVDCVSLIRKGR